MIYIVTGNPRSGTSVMMHILKSIGIPIYFDTDREKDLLKNHTKGNPYYYEDINALNGDIDLNIVKGKAVKIFATGIAKIPPFLLPRESTKIIFMYRNKVREVIKENNHQEKIGQLEIFLHNSDMMVQLLQDLDMLIIDFDQLIDRPEDILQKISTYLEIDFDIEKTSRLVKPKRRHFNKTYGLTYQSIQAMREEYKKSPPQST